MPFVYHKENNYEKELEKIVDFLCNHDRNDIVASYTIYCGMFEHKEIIFKYLYKGKLIETDYIVGCEWKIISNDKDKALIEVNKVLGETCYYNLNKETAVLTDITDYYKPQKAKKRKER